MSIVHPCPTIKWLTYVFGFSTLVLCISIQYLSSQKLWIYEQYTEYKHLEPSRHAIYITQDAVPNVKDNDFQYGGIGSANGNSGIGDNGIGNTGLMHINTKVTSAMKWKDRFKITPKHMADYYGFSVSKANLGFLEHFKSPCWLQEYPRHMGNAYKTNSYLKQPNESQATSFPKLRNTLEWTKERKDVLVNNAPCSGRCRFRCLPYIYVAGFPKSGTTDMCAKLLQHPKIIGTQREFYWWDQYRLTFNATISDYSDLFDGWAQAIVHDKLFQHMTIDCTSMTLYNAHWIDYPEASQQYPKSTEPEMITARDLYSVTSQAKLIVLMRNPTMRLYSHYNMFRGSVGSPTEFHRKVLASIDWWHNCTVRLKLSRKHCLFGSPSEMPPMPTRVGNPDVWWSLTDYSEGIRVGMYAPYVKDWIKVFPKQNILFVRTEDYSENTAEVLDEHVFPFLDAPTANVNITKIAKSYISNARNYTAPMLEKTKNILDTFYEPFNNELAELLGHSKWKWKDSN